MKSKTADSLNYRTLFSKSNEIYDAASRRKACKTYHSLWTTKSGQYHRFSEILHFIDNMDCSILDIGCGNGRLVEFLNYNGFTGKYTGVDINSNLLKEARHDFPGQEFVNADFFKKRIPLHDYVVMSGTLNANFGQDMDFVFNFIRRMHELSRKKSVFNAITEYVNFKEKEMYYINPAALIEYTVRNLSPKFEIRHSFVPYNFTMCIHKNIKWIPF
ncbi:MAG: hypothetical protein A2X48_18230 [Lentisphaerae bacterium GWF2_49_21]|nr:MAG: hypothetical protein A2X48_18230 [Lentisphaerae bacterium GWF2_49_21]